MSGVNNILDKEYVLCCEWLFPCVCEVDVSGRFCAFVAFSADEIDGEVDFEMSDEVGGEDGGALEDDEYAERLALVSVVDFDGELLYAVLDLLGGQ